MLKRLPSLIFAALLGCLLAEMGHAFWPFTEDETQRPKKNFEGNSPLDQRARRKKEAFSRIGKDLEKNFSGAFAGAADGAGAGAGDDGAGEGPSQT